MKLHRETLELRTEPKQFLRFTNEVQAVVGRSGIQTGTCTVFVKHTSASLIIQENADPAVLRDLEGWMSEMVSEARRWEHDAEGPDDMPSHVRTVLTSTSETLPVHAGRLDLGTWQGLYLWEHRAHAHQRRLIIHVVGE